jgi:hypothetical protein
MTVSLRNPVRLTGGDVAAAAGVTLLEQAEKIEESAAARIAKDPHADDIVEAGLGLLLFEAVRLSGNGDSDSARKVSRRRAPRPRHAATAR